MSAITIELPEEIADRVRAEAARRGTTEEAVVIEAVSEKINAQTADPPAQLPHDRNGFRDSDGTHPARKLRERLKGDKPSRFPPGYDGLFDSKGVPPASDFRRVNAETWDRDIMGDR